ncbi:MAG: hypothetical protein FWD89_03670 [Firmicutes bacterium]|nr:hypothetical protein [Bacillota bacterium]
MMLKLLKIIGERIVTGLIEMFDYGPDGSEMRAALEAQKRKCEKRMAKEAFAEEKVL